MLNHSLFKLVLFLSAGAVYMNTHKLDLNEIRGFGRKKPLLMTVFLTGALGIGGFPLFSGYISKTLLHESISEHAAALAAAGQSAFLFRSVEWLFLFSGGMTVAYMTKLFVVLFLEKNRDPAVQERYDANVSYVPPAGACALLIPAVLIPLFGCTPSLSMDRIAAAGIRNAESVFCADCSYPLLLVLGGEKRGISGKLLDQCDLVLKIPYARPFRGSLPSASAASVLAFEIFRKNQSN